MTVRKIVLAVCCLLFALPLFAQYNTTYNVGVTDITSYLPTVNAWKLLPGGGVCQANTLTEGGDGFIMCKGTDNYSYSYDIPSQTWKKWIGMGTAVKQLAVGSVNSVWSLQPTNYCTPYGLYGVFHWNGTVWSQPNTLACSAEFSVSGDDDEMVSIGASGSVWNCGTNYLLTGSCTQITGVILGMCPLPARTPCVGFKKAKLMIWCS